MTGDLWEVRAMPGRLGVSRRKHERSRSDAIHEQ